jgi:hypothetical protein
MPMSKFFQSAFMSGELSPLIKGRVDIDQYYKGMQTAENVVIVPQGGLKRRPGTQHIDVAEKIFSPFVGTSFITLPNGGTAANINDFTPSTQSVTTTPVGNLGTSGQSDYVVALYNLSSESSRGKFVEIKDIKLSGTGTGVFKLQISTDNVSYSTSKTLTVTENPQSIKARVSDTGDVKYFRIIRTGDTGNLAGLQVSISEFNVLFPTTTASIAKTFDFSIESDRHYLGVLTGGFDTFNFTITTGTPTVGNTYTVNSATYRVLSFVSGVAKTERTIGTNAPPTSGTLAGTPTLTYSAVSHSDSFGNMSFYRVNDTMKLAPPNSISITEFLTTPFASSEVQDVRDVQTENVMLMFHMEHFPKRIINTDENAFVIDSIPFLNIPQFDFNDALSPTPTAAIQVMTFPNSGTTGVQIGDRFQIDVEGVLSKNISFAGDSNANEQSSTIENIRKNLQDMPIFGDDGIVVTRTGALEYTITLDGNSSGTYELFTGFFTSGKATDAITFTRSAAGVPRSEDVWSDTRGYPRTATFFQGRLWFGGTKSKRQSVFASRAGSFFDFFTEEGDDDEGIFVTISSRNLTEIVDINPDRGLQIFTSGAEFLLTGNTPATVSIKAQTQHGSKFLEAKSLDGATLFIDKNGKTLRQYLYNYNEDAYNSVDISVLSSHLIDNPADVGVLSGSTTEDANYVVVINEDGSAAILNTLRSQDINGFTKWTNGSTGTVYPLNIISVSTVHNDLFFVNKRTTDTTTTYTIERWDQTYLLDSGIKLLSQTSIVGNELILSSAHLTGFTVSLVARGNVLPNKTVAATSGTNQNGKITLSDSEKAFIIAGDTSGGTMNVQVGFNFQPKMKSMPLNTTAGNIAGQNQMRDKKITRMNLRVLDSAGVVIDGNTVPTLEFGTASSTPLNSDLSPFTGVIQDNNGGNGWNIEVVPEITVPNPMPFHIQAIEYEVQSS